MPTKTEDDTPAVELTIVTITKDDPTGLAHTLQTTELLRNHIQVEHLIIDGGANNAFQINRIPKTTPIFRPARGISDAFNTGITSARGKWIWFLNGGDRMDHRLPPNTLLEILHNSTADIIVGCTTYQGELEPKLPPPTLRRWPPFRPWIQHPSTITRRTLFERFGYFDEHYTIGMDYEWWLRAVGPSTQVDTCSIPFAIFSRGGVSMRPESAPIIRREMSHALRRHQAALLRYWGGQTMDIIRLLLRSYRYW